MLRAFYKNAISIASLMALTLSANAQVREVIEALKPAKAFEGTPILKKKSQILQIGIGAPNNVSSLLSVSSTIVNGVNSVGGILEGIFGLGGSATNVTTTSSKLGPFTIDYELMVKENLGLGVGFSYAEASQTTTSGTKSTTVKLAGTSVLFSTIYHFYITDKLDPYAKGSVGATLWKGNYTLGDGSNAGNQNLPTPIAYRAIFGLRYFVSPTIAPFGEVSYTNIKFSANIGLAMKIK
jgi:Outer membrane protein beta-barrel domain